MDWIDCLFFANIGIVPRAAVNQVLLAAINAFSSFPEHLRLTDTKLSKQTKGEENNSHRLINYDLHFFGFNAVDVADLDDQLRTYFEEPDDGIDMEKIFPLELEKAKAHHLFNDYITTQMKEFSAEEEFDWGGPESDQLEDLLHWLVWLAARNDPTNPTGADTPAVQSRVLFDYEKPNFGFPGDQLPKNLEEVLGKEEQDVLLREVGRAKTHTLFQSFERRAYARTGLPADWEWGCPTVSHPAADLAEWAAWLRVRLNILNTPAFPKTAETADVTQNEEAKTVEEMVPQTMEAMGVTQIEAAETVPVDVQVAEIAENVAEAETLGVKETSGATVAGPPASSEQVVGGGMDQAGEGAKQGNRDQAEATEVAEIAENVAEAETLGVKETSGATVAGPPASSEPVVGGGMDQAGEGEPPAAAPVDQQQEEEKANEQTQVAREAAAEVMPRPMPFTIPTLQGFASLAQNVKIKDPEPEIQNWGHRTQQGQSWLQRGRGPGGQQWWGRRCERP